MFLLLVRAMDLELKRNAFHLVLGSVLASFVASVGKETSLAFFAVMIVIGVGVSKAIAAGFKPKPFKWMLDNFERKKNYPGAGAINFFIGIFVALAFFNKDAVFLGILALAFDDSFSTIIGKTFGKHFIRKNKTLEGTLGGLVASFLVLCLFINPAVALLVSVAAALVELFALLDDNLLIPLVSSIIIQLSVMV